MKISFSELSSFLYSPEDWAASVVGRTGSPRMSYAHVTRMAYRRFHQSGDEDSAKTALARYLDAYHLTNVDKRADAEEKLVRYVQWVQAAKPIVVGFQTGVRIDLGSGLHTSGQIHRVDLDLISGGYRAVMLEGGMTSPNDPRVAVLQQGYALLTGRSPDLVSPAHQNLDGSALTQLHLPADQRASVLDGLKEAARLAAARLALLRS